MTQSEEEWRNVQEFRWRYSRESQRRGAGWGGVSAEGLSRKRRLKVLSELQRCNSGLRSGKKKEKKKENFCYECIASWRRFFYFSSAIVL